MNVAPISETTWEGVVTPDNRRRASGAFRSTPAATESLLFKELERIGAKKVTVFVDVLAEDFKLNGGLRAHARHQSPRVVVEWAEADGTVKRMQCDQYTRWHANLRAIALTLESLRSVERWGVLKRGEQYAGLAKQLPRSTAATRGQALVREAGSVREAQRRHHPDHGGDEEAFKAIQAAIDEGLVAV